jgi:hypothetical protein
MNLSTKAGIHFLRKPLWILACAGMTGESDFSKSESIIKRFINYRLLIKGYFPEIKKRGSSI